MHTMRLNLRPKKHSALGLFYAAESDALSPSGAISGTTTEMPGTPSARRALGGAHRQWLERDC